MFHARRTEEPVVAVATSVWTCMQADCICWMRENLTFDKVPTCPICSSAMERDTKLLPPL
ncbi:cold-inducible protein YdjO-related protein [Brevibacillus daliensis]|uniref:cold-inducible protein YdjO-related protein n=1 Tax=Brevibacillus daliensis TaxID=2892995 RepID=UPI001E4AD763|nr:cold-inducible protein YdjO-related protein [Brevibacillus daliensis]